MNNKQPEPNNADAFFRLVLAEAKRSDSPSASALSSMPPVFSGRAVQWLNQLAANLGLIDAGASSLQRPMDAEVKR